MKDNTQPESVYIKIPKEIKVSHTKVIIKDIASIYCQKEDTKKRLENLAILELNPKRKQEKYMVSFMRVIALIKSEIPEIDIENIGETDFVISYHQKDTMSPVSSSMLEWGKTILVCFILFFGAAFTIMAFNTDVAVDELFEKLYVLITGDKGEERKILELSYCIGLPIGIIVFFDHFKPAVRRQDPTPMEVQMRTYEEDVNNVLIQNAARENRTIDISDKP